MRLFQHQDRPLGRLRESATRRRAALLIGQPRGPVAIKPLLPFEQRLPGNPDQRPKIPGRQPGPLPHVEQQEPVLWGYTPLRACRRFVRRAWRPWFITHLDLLCAVYTATRRTISPPISRHKAAKISVNRTVSPSAMAATLERVVTLTGRTRCVVVPSPSCPLLLAPHDHTVPSSFRTVVCDDPAAAPCAPAETAEPRTMPTTTLAAVGQCRRPPVIA